MATKRKLHEIDATQQAPGRLATQIAILLMGKHKPEYSLHIDQGDKVVVRNSSQILLTGKKVDQKHNIHHSMHPGGLKAIPIKKLLIEQPEEIIRHAVEKMLPKNKLRPLRMLRLSFK